MDFHRSKSNRQSCGGGRAAKLCSEEKARVGNPPDGSGTNRAEIAIRYMHLPRMPVQIRVLQNVAVESLARTSVRNYEHLDVAHDAGERDQTARAGRVAKIPPIT